MEANMAVDSSSSEATAKVIPPGKMLIFRKAYRNKWTGKLMVAAAFGLEAWPILVPIGDAANDNAPAVETPPKE